MEEVRVGEEEGVAIAITSLSLVDSDVNVVTTLPQRS